MCYVYGIMEKTQNLRKYNNNDIYENNNERYYFTYVLYTHTPNLVGVYWCLLGPDYTNRTVRSLFESWML